MKGKLFLFIIGIIIGVLIGLYFTKFSTMLIPEKHKETTIDYTKENSFLSELIEGHEEFKEHYYPLHEKDFLELVNKGQRPGAIIITCSDSRIMLDRLFSTSPGELFVVRNPGNLAPPYTEDTKELQSSVIASVEYAIDQLGIRDIIVMGHSDCGAMKAIYTQADVSSLPGLNRWLSTDQVLLQQFMKKHQDKSLSKSEGLVLFEKFSVVGQLYHLSQYPIVKKMLKAKKVNLHGWFYDLRSGGVDYYNPEKKGFLPLIRNIPPEKVQHSHA